MNEPKNKKKMEEQNLSTRTLPVISNLPDLVYYHLLKYLDLVDLLQLKLSSKKFYSLINDYYISQLSFANGTLIFSKDNFFPSTKSIKLRNQLSLSKLGLLNNSSANLLNLKHLRISCSKHKRLNFELNDLNKFTKLQVLELCKISINNPAHLQLPDLMALSIDIKMEESNKLLIDTANLHSLRTRGYSTKMMGNQIEFKHLSVEYLQICRYNDTLLLFENLECLEFGDTLNLEMNRLSNLRNLKRIRINLSCNAKKDIDVLKVLFILKSDDLEFVLDGVKVRELEKIDEYEGENSLSRFQLYNYADLEDDLQFVKELKYDYQMRELLRFFQLDDLFKKFNNIQLLLVSDNVVNENDLIELIKKCPTISRLHVKSILSQQFYDQLPVISSLSKLFARVGIINYQFIKKMAYLVELRISQDFGDQFNLNDLRCLKKLHFAINDLHIRIIKDDRDRYIVDNFKDFDLIEQKYHSQQELAEFFNGLRNG